MATFSKRLKELREEKGWSQDQLAELLGVQRPTVAGYESKSKNRIPRDKTLMKIAELFNTSTDYLLGRSDERNYTKFSGKKDLPQQVTEKIIGDLVKKYNLDLTDPTTAEKLETMIKLVYKDL
ncbi:transcriptional regulator with XRE-family HTH domain [Paenibacillus sp. 4624]|uniref:helix-turn-helix domain-containing protein n=1 Tax=Paenibacillus sp. 4624 TaxID=3156453 RepID=UPI003D226FA8